MLLDVPILRTPALATPSAFPLLPELLPEDPQAVSSRRKAAMSAARTPLVRVLVTCSPWDLRTPAESRLGGRGPGGWRAPACRRTRRPVALTGARPPGPRGKRSL